MLRSEHTGFTRDYPNYKSLVETFGIEYDDWLNYDGYSIPINVKFDIRRTYKILLIRWGYSV